MNKVFLTGITGLVGSAFVVALLRERQDYEFVCLVRRGGGKSAAERTEAIIRDECRFDGCPELADMILKHVSVIEGDVVTIDPEVMAKDPILAGVNKFFHCAADVNLGKDPTGKVFRINYDGTKNVVALAKLLGVKEFHYVATAYVAGKLKGVAYETCPTLDNGFNNPYEESKCKAERLVRESGFNFSIYRPAIITGRRSDGRIRKPLAFYRILEFFGKIKSHRCSKMNLDPVDWMDMHINFGTPTTEHIYFVPIDYVQEAITALFQKPVTNTAYNVTGDSPVTTLQILKAMCRVLRVDDITVGKSGGDDNPESKMVSRFVGDLYPYFYTDIVFDQSNVRKVLGDKILDWKYGSEALETLMRTFFLDYFPNVEWLQKVATTEPDRDPHCC